MIFYKQNKIIKQIKSSNSMASHTRLFRTSVASLINKKQTLNLKIIKLK